MKRNYFQPFIESLKKSKLDKTETTQETFRFDIMTLMLIRKIASERYCGRISHEVRQIEKNC